MSGFGNVESVREPGCYRVTGFHYHGMPDWSGELQVVGDGTFMGMYAVMPANGPVPWCEEGANVPLAYEFWCFATFERIAK